MSKRNWLKADHLSVDIDGLNIKPLERDHVMVSGAIPVDSITLQTNYGHLRLTDDGWKCERDAFCSFSGVGGTPTPRRVKIARAAVERIVSDWAADNAEALAEADRIWRNNEASRLEDSIAEHEQALAILRANLDACDNGRDYNVYPDIPTKR